MKSLIVILAAITISICNVIAQTGISINNNGATPDSSAILDISSQTKGLLIPRMTEAEKNAVNNPANGLIIYQIDNPQGLWFYDSVSTSWTQYSTGGSTNYYYADATGSSNNFDVSVSPTLTSYYKGLLINFKSNQCITGAATLNANGIGAVAIKKNIAIDLEQWDLAIGQMVSVMYDGTYFQLLIPASQTGPADSPYAGSDRVTDSTTVTLKGDVSYYIYDRGHWSIVSGAGGSFADINNPNSQFTGVPGTTYVLRWTFYNCCDSAYDDVNVEIISLPSKRVFVSSTNYTGNMSGIAAADGLCNTLAGNAGLGGTWKAWLSCSTENAKNRIGSGGWKRIDNVMVAGNIADLTDGSIANPINVDENGNTRNGVYVWTATENNGNWSSWLTACNCWTYAGSTSSDRTHLGITNSTSQWSLNYYDYCNQSYAIYCFEQ